MTLLMTVQALCAALDVAMRYGILDALDREPASTEELAGRLGLDTLACERVLHVLEAHGLLAGQGGRFEPVPEVRAELAGPRMSPDETARFWGHINEFVRTGATLIDPMDPRGRATAYQGVTPGLGRMFARPAARLADELAEGATRILDVGAGSGVWSLAMLERAPSARAVGLDLPDVLQRFLEEARRRGLEERVETCTGDYFSVPIPQPSYDRVLMANVVHLEPPERADRLIRRYSSAVSQGGALVIVDLLGDEAVEMRRKRAAYALHLAMRLRGARPHSERILRQWLLQAGFPKIDRLSLGDAFPGLNALVARRP